MAVAARESLDGFVGWVGFWVWQFDTVSLGQLEDQLGCHASLEVEVVLAFGEALKEFVQFGLAHGVCTCNAGR